VVTSRTLERGPWQRGAVAADQRYGRCALSNTLQWHLHDLWPELELPGGCLFYGKWSTRIARRLARAEQTMRVRIARTNCGVCAN
jgi:hypothetical protein